MVTGGAAGFIGSRLVEKLVENGGAAVRAFTRYTSRAELGLLATLPQTILSQIELVRGGICAITARWKALWKALMLFSLGRIDLDPVFLCASGRNSTDQRAWNLEYPRSLSENGLSSGACLIQRGLRNRAARADR